MVAAVEAAVEPGLGGGQAVRAGHADVHEDDIGLSAAVFLSSLNGIFAGTNDLVKKIGGTDPLDVESFVAQNRPAFDLHTA
ncbi:hypothetical protein [Streptomyces sp. NPDC001315]|uniref:hypothetical protein n=1 Tax=Streptomyces sp. NPDC001315 TaxID=3364562 RepID=UPI0036A2A76E